MKNSHGDDRLRLRARIFDDAVWRAYGIGDLSDLADRMHVSLASLSRLRRGETEPSARIIKQAARVFRSRDLGFLFYVEGLDNRPE